MSDFDRKKANILKTLAVPDEQYNDLSPKGSVDEAILSFINEINSYDGYVTTSSCAGRISVFLEGKKSSRNQNNDEAGKLHIPLAGPGGKGGGGRWLFVSHERVNVSRELAVGQLPERLGMRVPSKDMGSYDPSVDDRYIHLKFEPMILHILTASLPHAQTVISAALQAGFRESGAINVGAPVRGTTTPMVAVRSTGLALDTIIGYACFEEDGDAHAMLVTENYLRTVLQIANERFSVNGERIARFRALLSKKITSVVPVRSPYQIASHQKVWEDSACRRDRMRAEGLRHSANLKKQAHNEIQNNQLVTDTGY